MRQRRSASALARVAAKLGRGRRQGKPLPVLLAFSDPQRTPDLAALIAALGPGAALVLRAFGATDAEPRARALRRLARQRGVRLLIGADAGLAHRVRADGVHLPQRLAHLAGRLKRGHPRWIVTAAAHDLPSARRAARAGVDAVVLSTVFASRSPSAGRPLGPLRFAAMVRRIGAPVYGLGGVRAVNARRLLGSGAIGVAAIDGIRT